MNIGTVRASFPSCFAIFLTVAVTASLMSLLQSALADANCSCSGRDHVIENQFGDWRVRHYFNQETLEHRFSDAKSVIVTSDNRRIPFQFNRREDGWIAVIVPGWIPRMHLVIDGERFTLSSTGGLHTFLASAQPKFIASIAEARSPIDVVIEYSEDWQVSGTLSPVGTAAALRWIRIYN